MPRRSKNVAWNVRQLIIYNREKGHSIRKLAEMFAMPKSTVGKIVRQFDTEGRTESIRHKGRPKTLSTYDERFILSTLARKPETSAPALAAELSRRTKKEITPRMVRLVIHRDGMNSRTPRRKPFISKVNQAKRLEFAQKYITYNEKFWKEVLFADESKYNVFGSDGKRRVWRKPNTELQQKNLNVNVKHGGGNVQVWGCCAANGVGNLEVIDGTLTAASYIALLKRNLHASAEKLGIRHTFRYWQDNDPKHKAHITRNWLLYNCPHVIETPPQSPDLNIIENAWDYLERKLREEPIYGKAQLRERLSQEWARIPPEYFEKLASSMPRRLQAVIDAKGLHTKY